MRSNTSWYDEVRKQQAGAKLIEEDEAWMKSSRASTLSSIISKQQEEDALSMSLHEQWGDYTDEAEDGDRDDGSMQSLSKRRPPWMKPKPKLSDEGSVIDCKDSIAYSNDTKSYTGRSAATREAAISYANTLEARSKARRKSVADNDDDQSVFSRVTTEDKKLAMLGKLNLDSVTIGERTYYREEFCGSCGVIHDAPHLLDMYYDCKSCQSILREPIKLRQKYAEVEDIPGAFNVLIATYGDPYDGALAVDVTHQALFMINESTKKDRLIFKHTQRMDQRLGIVDPAPGRNKQFRMRYRIDGIHGTLILDFAPDNLIPTPFFIIVPETRYLKIHHAVYGHPKGLSSTNRMSFEVTEIMQSLVDQAGGSFLQVGAHTSLSRMFRDPCPGYPKDLRIDYEIVGRAGKCTYSEVRGFLRKRVFIQSTPTITPIVFVLSATYGVTPTGRKFRLDFISKQLSQIAAIEHGIRQGLRPQPDQLALLRSKNYLLEQQVVFQNLPINFIDVSVKLQALADKGGHVLLLDKNSFDPNLVFGNPFKGHDKILECHLDCQGHDSERLTSSVEMMSTGHTRNYITNKKARFKILVTDGPNGEGIMNESLDFRTDISGPVILISKAIYGEFTKADAVAFASAGSNCDDGGADLNYITSSRKIIDVTAELQTMVKGRELCIETDQNLNTLFKKDPSPGKRKQLKIEYVTKGFSGSLRVREKNDTLVAAVQVGYPPVPPPDDDDYVVM